MALYRAAYVRSITKRPIAIACFFVIAWARVARSEGPFSDPLTDTLRVPVSRIRGPEIPSQIVDLRQGIGPDEAATIALYSNPALRAIRDRRGLVALGIQRADSVFAKTNCRAKNFRSVDLDVAWQEWQIAMNARTAVYRVLGLNAEVSQALEATEGLQQSTDAMRKAVEAHEKTVLDLAAVESASQDSRATMLSLQQEFEKQRLGFNKILGVEPDVKVALHSGLSLPSRLSPPAQHDLSDNLESRRLDLLGLQHGLESQDATVRAAILAQFPKMSAGFVKASDTTNVHTTGFMVAVDVPIFDRNQGVIATERATRQRLRDEYNQRVFEARSDIATAIADIRSLDRQIAAAEEALPLLEKLVSSAQTAVEQGNADVLGYYTARSNLLQKRIQLIKLQEQLLEAHTALEIASGRYLPMNKALQAR